MIGCAVVGGLLLLGVAKAVHRHRYGYAYGCDGPWRHHGCHGHARFSYGHGHAGPQHDGDGDGDGPGPGERSWSPQWFVNRVLGRLQTSPAQSREVSAAFEEFAAEMKGLRGEGKRTREDLAAALRKPAFDEVLLGELYARHDTVIDKGRRALVGFLDRVHRVLEEEQRERLAVLIEKGPQFWRYRDNW